MSWSVSDRFPSWGETGESPGSGFFYEGGDQVNEKHLDYLWNSLKGLEDDVQAALNDIDSDSDGVVDKAEAGAAGFDLDGDLNAANGETIWDESQNFIPQARLQNDSITLNGNTVALGGSITFNTFSGDHADLSGVGASDHHSRYTDSEARTAVNGSSIDVLTASSELGNPTYQSLSDVPTNLPEGTQVYVLDENQIYVEDGT
jgi:hypothetical protein